MTAIGTRIRRSNLPPIQPTGHDRAIRAVDVDTTRAHAELLRVRVRLQLLDIENAARRSETRRQERRAAATVRRAEQRHTRIREGRDRWFLRTQRPA